MNKVLEIHLPEVPAHTLEFHLPPSHTIETHREVITRTIEIVYPGDPGVIEVHYAVPTQRTFELHHAAPRVVEIYQETVQHVFEINYQGVGTSGGGGVEIGDVTHVFDKPPVEAADGSRIDFSLTDAYIASSLRVFVAGSRLSRTHANFTELNPTQGLFRLAWAPDPGEAITTDYIKGVV